MHEDERKWAKVWQQTDLGGGVLFFNAGVPCNVESRGFHFWLRRVQVFLVFIRLVSWGIVSVGATFAVLVVVAMAVAVVVVSVVVRLLLGLLCLRCLRECCC